MVGQLLLLVAQPALACDPPSRRECAGFNVPATVTTGVGATVKVSGAALGMDGSRTAEYELPFAKLEGVYQACWASLNNPKDDGLCSMWQGARRSLIEQVLGDTGPVVSGAWEVEYSFQASTSNEPAAACADFDSGFTFAETWEIKQDGPVVEVKTKLRRERTSNALPFKWYSGSLNRSEIQLTSDARHGRGKCSLQIDGARMTGDCSVTSPLWGAGCTYAFGVAGHLASSW